MRGVAPAWSRLRLGSSGLHLPALGSWVLTVLRRRAPVHLRSRRREEGCISGEQGGTRFHEDAEGGLCRPPAMHSGSTGRRRPPQGVHARRRCAQARRVVCGYQSPSPADTRKLRCGFSWTSCGGGKRWTTQENGKQGAQETQTPALWWCCVFLSNISWRM